MASTFAARIRALRLARGLSLHDLATDAACHVTTISQVERGLRPSITLIAKLARALDVPPASLAADAIADLPEAEPAQAAR